MIKHLITIFTVLSASMIYAQEGRVGINTTEPKATLDVTASATDLTRTDGFIAPRLTGNQLKNKDSKYTNEQTGAIVYATEAASPTTAKTINVTEAGYYYFDGTVWQTMEKKEPWRVQNTMKQATENAENIYQQGKVAVGFTDADAVSGKQFEVKGNMKAKATGANSSTAVETTTNMITANAEDANTSNYFTMLPNLTDVTVAKNDYSQMYSSQVMPNMQNHFVIDYTSDMQSGFSSNTSPQAASASMYANNQWGDRETSIRMASFEGSQPLGSAEIYFEANDNAGDERFARMEMSASKGIKFFLQKSQSAEQGNYGFPWTNGKRGQVMTTRGTPADTQNFSQLTWRDVADLLILKSPNGNCWKLSVSDTGALSTVPTGCEVPDYNPADYGGKSASGSTGDSLAADQLMQQMKDRQNQQVKSLREKTEKLKSEAGK